MDALIAAIMATPHAGDCGFLIESATGRQACSCGVHDLIFDAVLIKADLVLALSECRGEALKAVGDLLESFKTE